MTLMGHVQPTFAYTFDDGFEYSFHTAVAEQDGYEIMKVFPSRMDTWPSITAKAEGIEYKFLRNSTTVEARRWFMDHPEIEIKKERQL